MPMPSTAAASSVMAEERNRALAGAAAKKIPGFHTKPGMVFDSYCPICDLPMRPILIGIPGHGDVPRDGADWLYDVDGLNDQGDRTDAVRHDYTWRRAGDNAAEDAWLAAHARCITLALEKVPRENVFATVRGLPRLPWHIYHDQTFMWNGVPHILEGDVDDALSTRFDEQNNADVLLQVVTQGTWHAPGSERADEAICDKCDGVTDAVGCFAKFGLDVCKTCADAMVVPPPQK